MYWYKTITLFGMYVKNNIKKCDITNLIDIGNIKRLIIGVGIG